MAKHMVLTYVHLGSWRSPIDWGSLNGLVLLGKPQPETIDFPIKIMGTNPLGTSNDDDLGLARNGLETSI